jgi:membrane associated rhomboid family serine protease
MSTIFAGLVGNHLLGGRMYRDEHEFRRYYQQRGGIGGFFGTLLSSSEFELFLCLLTGLICLTVVRDHLMTSPVTSATILFLSLLHFEKHILGNGNTFLTSNNFHNYTFHPNRIMVEGQWYRLWTGPIIHTSKLHLYLNMTALVALCHVEARNPFQPLQYAMFLAILMGLAGLAHCLLASKYQKTVLNSFTSGYSGVVFALKTVANSYEGLPMRAMNFPLIGDVVTYSLPVEVPTFAHVFCELFLVTILFPDVSVWSHLGGIVAGFLLVGLQKVLFPEAHFFSRQHEDGYTHVHNGGTKNYSGHHSSAGSNKPLKRSMAEQGEHMTDRTTMGDHPPPFHFASSDTPESGRPDSGWMKMEEVRPFLQDNCLTLILLAVITYLVYKMNDHSTAAPSNEEAEELRRRLEELERRAGRVGDAVPYSEDNQPLQEHSHHSRGGKEELSVTVEDDNSDLNETDKRSVKSSSTDTSTSLLGVEVGSKNDNTTGKKDESSLSSSIANEMDVISMDDNDESLTFLTDGVSLAFATALKEMVHHEDKEVVIHSLTTVRRLIANATSKGQQGGKEAAKFRSVRLNNPHIVKCNIDGALDLMTSVGFVLTVDEYDEPFLVYPRQVELPLWLPEALECLSQQARALKSLPAHNERPKDQNNGDKNQKTDYRTKAREAALNRQASSESRRKTKVNKKREGLFAAGMGGGDARTTFYSGGT